MRLRSITEWRTRSGRRRRIRLYNAWMNMQGRVKGHKDSHGVKYWHGLECGFAGWAEFRAWALANGFSKVNNSLDRIDAREGYVPGNLRWLPWDLHRKMTSFQPGPPLPPPVYEPVTGPDEWMDRPF